MSDILKLALLLLLFFPLTVLLSRLQLSVFPAWKSLPAQGTVTRSAFGACVLLLIPAWCLLGDSLGGRTIWLLYTGIILFCFLLLYVSVMCVSESGRRFYFMVLIEKAGGATRQEFQAAYGKTHMLAVRLERLLSWGVLHKSGQVYRLQRRSAYWYSRFFELWGKLLGFNWIHRG